MKNTAIILLLIVAGVFLAGCTVTSNTGQDTALDAIRARFQYQEDWSPGLGCYGRITGYAFNAGNTTADNVVLNFNLVDTKTSTIRDSRSVYIGTMGSGQSVTFETLLDGECLKDYRVDAAIMK